MTHDCLSSVALALLVCGAGKRQYLAALSKLLKCEGGAGYWKLVAPPILLEAPPILMELPYVDHQMLNFILI